MGQGVVRGGLLAVRTWRDVSPLEGLPQPRVLVHLLVSPETPFYLWPDFQSSQAPLPPSWPPA